MSSPHTEPSRSDAIEKIEAVNKIATGVCIGLTCTPSGVTNVIGAGGLLLTSGFGLGIDFYEAYVTESKDKSHFWVNLGLTTLTISAAKGATELTGTANNYCSAANRFYTINPNGTWRWAETQAGIIGNEIRAGISAIGIYFTNLYQTYFPQ